MFVRIKENRAVNLSYARDINVCGNMMYIYWNGTDRYDYCEFVDEEEALATLDAIMRQIGLTTDNNVVFNNPNYEGIVCKPEYFELP